MLQDAQKYIAQIEDLRAEGYTLPVSLSQYMTYVIEVAQGSVSVATHDALQQIAANMDLLPTCARLAGTKSPDDRVIDGRDLWPIMAGKTDATSPHEAFYYYDGSRPSAPANIQAVRDARWKLHLTLEASELRGTALYDLQGDVGETRDRMPCARPPPDRLRLDHPPGRGNVAEMHPGGSQTPKSVL